MRRGTARALLAGALVLALAAGCRPGPSPSGHQLFLSPQARPIAVAGRLLVVANTTSGTVSVHDIRAVRGRHDGLLAEIPVGVDPVGVAVRPGSSEVWVTNHISDSISVIDLQLLDVVDTIQGIDPATGATTTDAPVGIAFAGPTRAFVSLDDRNEVLVIDTDAAGRSPAVTARLAIPAQAPRALAVSQGKLYVAAFESENQTEFPTCGPNDPRLERNGGEGLDEDDPWDEGCEFATEIIESVNVDIGPDSPADPDDDAEIDFQLELGTIFDFAAVNPNIGGRIIHDRDRPDRDLFVFDADTLALEQVVEGVGTLLYGMAASQGRVWVTNTEARNELEGLAALGNRMFENRLTWLDCPGGVCGAPRIVDLDANPFGVPVPTPYGLRSTQDGSLLVASVAGSDGRPGLGADPDADIPGLVTLDAEGDVLGHVPTGAIPQGVALSEGPAGPYAFVLNTAESSVSMVDLADPAAPRVMRSFPVGSDPTPEAVRQGRIAFSSARASTSGTFSCLSCHPDGNIDQVLWVINTVEGPNDFEGECDPSELDCPEPRTTMPIRGLRDTLPLHWVGNLADPFENLEGQLAQPEDAAAPDCDLEADGEAGCARHLVDASLAGVMCDPLPSCAVGPSGRPGALGDAERDAMAEFLLSVSFPPSPERRPTDRLSPLARQGVSDFFTDEDGLGVGSGNGDVGNAVGFAPVTCADNAGGCHALPLTASTNSTTVGGFDAPSLRGIWDRFLLFSNGNVSSEEWLRLAQACADGSPPGGHDRVTVNGSFPLPNLIFGDPCALAIPALGEDGTIFGIPIPSFLAGFAELDPFEGVPSGEEIYDPAVGMTERGQFMGSFEAIFHLAYGVRGGPMWQFFNEMSVGLPGLAGRQLSLDRDAVDDPEVVARMERMEAYAEEGRIDAVARNRGLGEWRFEDGRWRSDRRPGPLLGLGGGRPHRDGRSGAELRELVEATGAVVTITAQLRTGVTIGGADRQILLDIDPDVRARERAGEIAPLALPEPSALGGDTIRLGASYVQDGAKVLVDGELCETCSWTSGLAPETGEPIVDLVLAERLEPGVHVVQMLNPNGWMSNEMPVVARAPGG